LLAGDVGKLPIDLRTYLLPFIYGLLGGLAAVAFQRAVSTLFTIFWERPAQQMPPGNLALFSLATILAAVTATFVCHIFWGDDPAFVVSSHQPSSLVQRSVLPSPTFVNSGSIWSQMIGSLSRWRE
jgi:hypothetical protein